MCNCKLKSKIPTGPSGNFNFVFVCTDPKGKVRNFTSTGVSEERAKEQALQECSEYEIPPFNKDSFDKSVISGTLSILAHAKADDIYIYIYPNPCDGTYYKIKKDDVITIEKYSFINCGENGLIPIFDICIKQEDIIEKVVPSYILKSQVDLFTGTLSPATLTVKIDFTASGEGIISFKGKSFPCLGNNTIKYPKDLTIQVSDKYLRKYSKEYDVWMDYAILIWGQRGIYVHYGSDTVVNNGGVSAGCIHVEKNQIVELFNWIAESTRFQISYPW